MSDPFYCAVCHANADAVWALIEEEMGIPTQERTPRTGLMEHMSNGDHRFHGAEPSTWAQLRNAGGEDRDVVLRQLTDVPGVFALSVVRGRRGEGARHAPARTLSQLSTPRPYPTPYPHGTAEAAPH